MSGQGILLLALLVFLLHLRWYGSVEHVGDDNTEDPPID